MLRHSLILFSATLLLSVSSHAQSDADSLQRLHGVSMKVQVIGDAANEYELSTDTLATYAQLRLREAGIPVLPDKQENPRLVVIFNTLRLDKSGNENTALAHYAIATSVILYDNAVLVRDARTNVLAVSWGTLRLSAYSANEIGKVRDVVLRDAMDSFINDYLAANPKH